jgi:transcriptional regulator with XRE-family HTH domain
MEILSLGEKIKRKRKEFNMTLKDLAGDRITPGQISLVESGKSNPSMDLLEYLANTLNTSIEYLMESEESQAEKICSYFENMTEAFISNEDLVSAELYLEKALQYTKKYNLEYMEAKNLYLSGIVHLKKGEISLAQKLFLSSNIIFIKHNSNENIINTFLKLGVISLSVKTYASALGHFRQAEKVFIDNETANDFLIGEIYYYIAYTYNKLDSKEEAFNYAKLSQDKFRQMDSKKEYATALLNISKEYSNKGDLKNAIKYSEKTKKVFGELNDMVYLSEIENNLGKLFSEFEDFTESFLHLNKSKDLRQRNKDTRLVETLINICENYIHLKDVSNSKIILQEIMNKTENSNEKIRKDFYLLKYRLDILEGNIEGAEFVLKAALEFVTINGYKKEQAEIAFIIGKFYIDYGQVKKAEEFLLKGVETFKSLGTFKGLD